MEILEMKNLGTGTASTEASFMNRIKELKERISGIEDTIVEYILCQRKGHVKCKEIPNTKHPGIQDTYGKKKKKPKK